MFYIFRRRSRHQQASSICVIDPEKIFVVRDAEHWEKAYELLLKDVQQIKVCFGYTVCFFTCFNFESLISLKVKLNILS